MDNKELEKYKIILNRLHVGMKLKDEFGNIKTITGMEYCKWSDKQILEDDICIICPGRISLDDSYMECHSNSIDGFYYEIVEEDFFDKEEFEI